RWPGHVPAGAESHAVVHNCDVFPTFLAAANVTPDPAWKIDGANLLDVWCSKSKPPDRTLFWEWREGGNIQYAAMHGDFKLVITGNNQPELFNVESDPGERREINAQDPGEVKRMKEGIEQWLSTESSASRMRRKTATTGAAED